MPRRLTAITVLALATALVLAACGGAEQPDPGAERPSEPAAPPAAGASDEALPRELTLRIGEWYFRTDEPKVKAGKVTMRLRNVGDIEHDVVLVKTDRPAEQMPMTPEGAPDVERAGHVMMGGHGDGGHGSEDGDDIHVMPGEMEHEEVTLQPGRYAFVCSLPGHYQAGQFAALRVVP